MRRRFVSFILGASIIATGLLLGTQAPARAGIIDGTWSGSGSGAIGLATNAPDPVSFSATFSFSDKYGLIDFPISDFTTSFGATAAIFIFDKGENALDILFTLLGDISLIAGFQTISTSPSFLFVVWEQPSIGVQDSYTMETGSFTPAATSVPESGTLALFGGGLASLMGLLFRRSRKSIIA
jgi:hypothetical protein